MSTAQEEHAPASPAVGSLDFGPACAVVDQARIEAAWGSLDPPRTVRARVTCAQAGPEATAQVVFGTRRGRTTRAEPPTTLGPAAGEALSDAIVEVVLAREGPSSPRVASGVELTAGLAAGPPWTASTAHLGAAWLLERGAAEVRLGARGEIGLPPTPREDSDILATGLGAVAGVTLRPFRSSTGLSGALIGRRGWFTRTGDAVGYWGASLEVGVTLTAPPWLQVRPVAGIALARPRLFVEGDPAAVTSAPPAFVQVEVGWWR